VKAFGAAGEAPQGENHERRRRQHGQGDPQDPEADEHKTRDDQQRTPNRWLAQCRTCPGGIARSPFRGRLPAICRAARSGSSPVSGTEPQQGTGVMPLMPPSGLIHGDMSIYPSPSKRFPLLAQRGFLKHAAVRRLFPFPAPKALPQNPGL